ncbi:spherulation-specific family 4 protein [Ralstonia sp. UBA689]|uniref:spherulation-specific family 4 protein n=1 Tax=Ralstonia sp. UBA689 TaxID=1947373 RepID=UPI0025E1BA2F|nr:spherulation-specific family 4 protein [Ralstonia sp. UBA689]
MKTTQTGGLAPAFATKAVASSAGALARIASAVATIAACTLIGAPHAKAEGLLVPAYIYPSGTGATQWSTLASTAKTVPTTVILNPNSGPGTTQDPNYVAAVAKVHASGGKVIGYVSTSYTNRSLSAVVQDINTYQALYQVDGFFIDEMTDDSVTAHIQFYQSVYNYIKGLSANYAVTGNPGTNVPEIYASLPVADQIVVFEDNAKHYASYAPLAWQANYPTSRFAHIVYAASATQMQTFMQSASAKDAGSVYFTSKTLPNPYGALPAYWSQEVSAAGAAK